MDARPGNQSRQLGEHLLLQHYLDPYAHLSVCSFSRFREIGECLLHRRVLMPLPTVRGTSMLLVQIIHRQANGVETRLDEPEGASFRKQNAVALKTNAPVFGHDCSGSSNDLIQIRVEQGFADPIEDKELSRCQGRDQLFKERELHVTFFNATALGVFKTHGATQVASRCQFNVNLLWVL
jgi:hypothetical protein